MDELKKIIGDYDIFLDSVFAMIEDIDLDVEKLPVDHLCYRVETLNEYEEVKNLLSPLGHLLTEAEINGRPISTFKLHQAIVYKNRSIPMIELPAPKEEKAYKSGLEHLEFVTKEPLQKIVNRYPMVAFETYGIHKKVNPDITLKLGAYCIRFHNDDLETIIKKENRPKSPSGFKAQHRHKHKNQSQKQRSSQGAKKESHGKSKNYYKKSSHQKFQA